MMKFIATVVVSAYIGAGLFSGLLMQQAIPALNGWGVAYIAATWPRQIICAQVASGCDAVPTHLVRYLFTFD
jgi:hypothetical protein